MLKKEYIEAIKAYNKEMEHINFLGIEVKENSIEEEIKNIIQALINKGKSIVQTQQFQVDYNDFSEYVRNLNINVDNVCKLGGIAHLLILNDIKLKLYPNILPSNFTQDVLKELAIEEFLKKGLNPNLKDDMGYTFIETAIFGRPGCSRETNISKTFPSIEIEINCNSNNPSFIYSLIKKAKEFGFDVNTKDNLGNSIIHTAINSPYFSGNIVKLLEVLGDDFDINTRNEDGQDIIECLDHYIKSHQSNSNCLLDSYKPKLDCYNEDVIKYHVKYLKLQRENIIEYIMLNRNNSITNPKIKETFINKLNFYKKQRNINKRMSVFLGEPQTEVTLELSTITINELNSLIQKELSETKYFTNRVIAVTKKYFGLMYKVVCKIIMLGQEKVIIANNKNGININMSIEEIGSIFKQKKSYPYRGTIIEKIQWLHDVIVLYEKKEQKIANAKIKAKKNR